MQSISVKRVVASLLLSLCCSSATASDGFPMPRDAVISTLVDSYSEDSCAVLLKGKTNITQAECSARSKNAKKICPSILAENMPDRIDQKQLFMLLSRSTGCHLNVMMGKPFDNAPWDRMAEDIYKQQSGS